MVIIRDCLKQKILKGNRFQMLKIKEIDNYFDRNNIYNLLQIIGYFY